MFFWPIVFLVIAVVTGLFGFTSLYLAGAGIAKVLFFLFLILFIVSLLSGSARRPVV